MTDVRDCDVGKSKRQLPAGVWILGFVSLLMDTSSELIHSLLPVFVTTTLGASMAELGVLEGGAEAIAMITKMFSGALSDWLGKRKMLTVIGYGLAAITKPLFPLARTLDVVFTARYIDRVGKGIRGAPRDALLGDITPPEVRGAAYGLRQALDTVGAFLGPGLAILFMLLLADNIHHVLWIAVVPAFLSVGLLIFGVRESEQRRNGNGKKLPLGFKGLKNLGTPFWWVVGIGGLLTLARFSEAFLIIRAQSVGVPIAWVPSVMIVMSVVYALAAYPAGKLSDTVPRHKVLMVSAVFLVIADLVLAFTATVFGVMAGVALWGLHLAFSQGLLAALVADTAPAEWRGTGFGVFNLVSGIVLLAASSLAGVLWEVGGPEATFLAGACFTVFSFIGLVVFNGQKAKT